MSGLPGAKARLYVPYTKEQEEADGEREAEAAADWHQRFPALSGMWPAE